MKSSGLIDEIGSLKMHCSNNTRIILTGFFADTRFTITAAALTTRKNMIEPTPQKASLLLQRGEHLLPVFVPIAHPKGNVLNTSGPQRLM